MDWDENGNNSFLILGLNSYTYVTPSLKMFISFDFGDYPISCIMWFYQMGMNQEYY
jgi:hypothetical protein